MSAAETVRLGRNARAFRIGSSRLRLWDIAPLALERHIVHVLVNMLPLAGCKWSRTLLRGLHHRARLIVTRRRWSIERRRRWRSCRSRHCDAVQSVCNNAGAELVRLSPNRRCRREGRWPEGCCAEGRCTEEGCCPVRACSGDGLAPETVRLGSRERAFRLRL